MKSCQNALQLSHDAVEMLPAGLPIHVAHDRVGLYPTSQWSAKLSDVPVLPATGCPFQGPDPYAVPSLLSNTVRSTCVTAPATRSSRTRAEVSGAS